MLSMQMQKQLLTAKVYTGERNDTIVGTKAIRFPANLCILEYFRTLLASRNFNNSAMLVSQCLLACTEAPLAGAAGFDLG